MGRLCRFLAVLLSAIALPAAGAAQVHPYAGQTLHVLAFGDSHGRAVARALGWFEAETGATVQLDLVPTQALSNKVMIDQAGGGTYDLYAVDEPLVPLFAALLVPLRNWPQSALALGRSDERALYPRASWEASSYHGIPYGLPVSGNVYIYVCRSDLFEDPVEQAKFAARYGYALAPPNNTQQMRDIAEFFTRPPHLYGFAPFTQVSEGATVEVLWLLATFETRLFDEQMHWALDETRAEAALAFYSDMMRFAPPGAEAWHHGERMGAYRRGQIAQIMTWPIFFADLENPDKSLVAGHNLYRQVPAGPYGHRTSMLGSWILAIPRSASHVPLAAEFARWWTSREVGETLANAGLSPVRADLLTDQALLRTHRWLNVVRDSLMMATVRPRSVRYHEMSDLIARVFSKMVSGQVTPHQAVQLLKQNILGGDK